jgi:hypothetical protein
MRMRRGSFVKAQWLVGSIAVVAFAVGSSPAAAGTATVAPLTVASGPSPFAGCHAGATPSSINYLNAEVEPWIAVNPTTLATPRVNLIATWQQDRWSDGGAHGLVAGASFDGGKTWSETPLPFSACAPGGLSYERASDPWVSFGPDGTAYAISISFNATNNDNAVAAATSTNGGKTWGNLRTIKADNNQNQFFNDKESITADPVKAGVAYAVWDRLVSPTDNPDVFLHNVSSFTGPTWFSKTTDGGKTWSQAKIIVPTGQNNQTIGNVIVIDPRTGALYDFFNLIVGTGSNATKVHGNNVAFIKSTDGGDTWSAPGVISTLGTVFVSDPNTGQSIRTGDIIPEPAIDPATGQLYVVWQDARFTGGEFDQVAISTSSDGGHTWSSPGRVNTPTGSPAFTPSVHVNSTGVVGVTYYDFRTLQPGNTTTLPTDVWFISSPRGGAAFGNEVHLAGSFDMLTAPNAGGFFVGDYEGMTSAGTVFKPFFVIANSGNTTNRTDAVTTSVTP